MIIKIILIMIVPTLGVFMARRGVLYYLGS
jgi:uncharacterized membrane protein YqaE (UPF0057 family)